ncbi:response regulator transcription factor [Cohnella thailandensis]|uniref:Response regulator transcription factor n=1 Tax=Cohnella thailandensis TaxID=557557 RepID=A0A841T314_9BACL|nr:response regulator transcription factor [Cohnella thailandensis]MBB6635491.1 response regulator transcription factor [Cohnella thailandensis]MBP1974871.1 DNA-binding NarL/FixJ family response regulator [Cohnella thailandensis]
MLRILLADDHPMFREGVRSILENTEGLTVIGEAKTGEEAVRLALELKPHVVLMDIRMPGLNGIEATARIREAAPAIGILICTMFKDDVSVITAMKAGARGYILKDSDKDDILRAIWATASGEAIFSGDVADRMVDLVTKPMHRLDAFAELTYREREVLGMVADGVSNAEISSRLELSQKTVSNYLTNIFNKLQVTGRAEAIAKVKEAGGMFEG